MIVVVRLLGLVRVVLIQVIDATLQLGDAAVALRQLLFDTLGRQDIPHQQQRNDPAHGLSFFGRGFMQSTCI